MPPFVQLLTPVPRGGPAGPQISITPLATGSQSVSLRRHAVHSELRQGFGTLLVQSEEDEASKPRCFVGLLVSGAWPAEVPRRIDKMINSLHSCQHLKHRF
eukprot:1160141-Pelagomonas_calceolata.AAC.13